MSGLNYAARLVIPMFSFVFSHRSTEPLLSGVTITRYRDRPQEILMVRSIVIGDFTQKRYGIMTGHRDAKLRTLANFAFDADFSAQNFGKTLDEKKPQTGAFKIAPIGAIHLAELLED